MITIAVDAMGADLGPKVVIKGLELAQKRYRQPLYFLLYGNKETLSPFMTKDLDIKYDLYHTEVEITSDDKPSKALRMTQPSSMHLALQAVEQGKAEGMISAGNTGSMMVLAKHIVKMLPGILRPVMASTTPTSRGETVILDLGANLDCNEHHLVQYALMGALLSRSVCGLERPSVGLLNVGVEENKGPETLKKADALLKNAPDLPFSYHGFVEGFDIFKGTVDIVVTDGFTGNAVLKSVEGVVQVYNAALKKFCLSSSWIVRAGYLLISPSLKRFMEKFNPHSHNGAIFLGLNGICVKSHGECTAASFSHAVTLVVDLISHRINDRIGSEMEALSPAPIAARAP